MGSGSWAGWVWVVLKPTAKSSVAAWRAVSVFMGRASSPLQVQTEILRARMCVALARAPDRMKIPRTRPLLLPLAFLSMSDHAAPVT